MNNLKESIIELKSYENQIINLVSKNLSNKFQEIIIEGLKLKGYEFQSQEELFQFIKENCVKHDYPHLHEAIYFVKGERFLLHKYETEFSFSENRKSINASYGSFAFL
jgi:hypothetical protein